MSFTPTQLTAIKLMAEAAVYAEKVTGCPAELQVGQAADETEYLKHMSGNNCFGIKSYVGQYGGQLLETQEWFNDAQLAQFLRLGNGRTAKLVEPEKIDSRGRKLYVVKDWFATFRTLGDCFARRAKMWDRGPYAPAAATYRATKDLTRLVHEVGKIYATAENYADVILSIIHRPEVQAAIAAARSEAK